MKRRSLFVNCVATSISTAIYEGAAAASASLRQSPMPAQHLAVHMTVWVALVDRASSVLPDMMAALCAEKTYAGAYRFQVQEAGHPARERSWRLHTESASVLNAAAPKAVLLCSSSLAARTEQLTVLWVKGVVSAGGIGLYHCDGSAGPAVLLLPAPHIPPKLLGLALND